MVTYRGGRDTERIVRFDDRDAFFEIGLEGALEHIARIDQEHGTAIQLAQVAQCLDVRRDRDEAFSLRIRVQLAMDVVEADERQRDDVLARPRGGAGGEQERADAEQVNSTHRGILAEQQFGAKSILRRGQKD